MDHEIAAYLENVRLRRAELGESMGGLQAALTNGHEDPRRWTERIYTALVELRADLDTHVEVTERPEGLYDSVREDAPRLAGPLRQLQDEHPGLLALADSVLAEVTAAAEGEVEPDRAALQSSIAEFMRRLGHHRQRGADLIFEAYQIDVGGSG